MLDLEIVLPMAKSSPLCSLSSSPSENWEGKQGFLESFQSMGLDIDHSDRLP